MAKKKRYAQTRKDRSDESKGMKMAEREKRMKLVKKYSMNEDYAGYDNKVMMERRDAGMIHEDHSAVANLPRNVKYVEYPQVGYNSDPALNDRLSGVDGQMNEDRADMFKGFFPKKY